MTIEVDRSELRTRYLFVGFCDPNDPYGKKKYDSKGYFLNVFDKSTPKVEEIH